MKKPIDQGRLVGLILAWALSALVISLIILAIVKIWSWILS